jgi:hypothetical protein
MKSPFVTSDLARAPLKAAVALVPARAKRARAPDAYATARAGLSILLSALTVAVVTFFGVMTILMAFG